MAEAAERVVEGVRIRCTRGDIADQPDLEAVVNAANAELRTGGGVAGALHRAAGPGLEEEGRPLAPIRPGQAVRTSGHRLANAHVIHVLGPVYGLDEPADRLLADGYRNALRLAEHHGIASVGFPAISTGAFGYPLDPAAEIALRTVREVAPELRSLREVRFVLFDEAALGAFTAALEAVAGAGRDGAGEGTADAGA